MKVLHANSQLTAAVKKAYKHIRFKLTVEIAKMRMRIGIKAVTEIHKYQSRTYLNVDYKTLRQYIVLLERPVQKKQYFLKWENKKLALKYRIKSVTFEDRLFWVNKANFKKIKRAGWLPQNMLLEELRAKAFYVSSLKRTYREEYWAKYQATDKYIKYLKSQQP